MANGKGWCVGIAAPQQSIGLARTAQIAIGTQRVQTSQPTNAECTHFSACVMLGWPCSSHDSSTCLVLGSQHELACHRPKPQRLACNTSCAQLQPHGQGARGDVHQSPLPHPRKSATELTHSWRASPLAASGPQPPRPPPRSPRPRRRHWA